MRHSSEPFEIKVTEPYAAIISIEVEPSIVSEPPRLIVIAFEPDSAFPSASLIVIQNQNEH